MSFTFGAELELADFTRSLVGDKIKEWGVLDVNDCTVVNSDGSVGNPYEGDKGGEIVTRICNSPEDLAYCCDNIIKSLDTVAINHSCWLHIHVGTFKDLSLEQLKSIAAATHKWVGHLINNTELNPPKLTPSGEVHYLRNRTRLSGMIEDEFFDCQIAKTPERFWSNFERKRHLINIRPLRSYGTIEYRFLAATLKYEDFLSAAKMCQELTEQIIENKVDFNLKNVYNGQHQIIDEELEARFRSQRIEYKQKVDNFTGEPWLG